MKKTARFLQKKWDDHKGTIAVLGILASVGMYKITSVSLGLAAELSSERISQDLKEEAALEAAE